MGVREHGGIGQRLHVKAPRGCGTPRYRLRFGDATWRRRAAHATPELASAVERDIVEAWRRSRLPRTRLAVENGLSSTSWSNWMDPSARVGRGRSLTGSFRSTFSLHPVRCRRWGNFELSPSIVGNGLLARVIADKFANHIPLNRQVDLFALESLDLSLSTLGDLVRGSDGLLRRIVEAIRTSQAPRRTVPEFRPKSCQQKFHRCVRPVERSRSHSCVNMWLFLDEHEDDLTAPPTRPSMPTTPNRPVLRMLRVELPGGEVEGCALDFAASVPVLVGALSISSIVRSSARPSASRANAAPAVGLRRPSAPAREADPTPWPQWPILPFGGGRVEDLVPRGCATTVWHSASNSSRVIDATSLTQLVQPALSHENRAPPHA